VISSDRYGGRAVWSVFQVITLNTVKLCVHANFFQCDVDVYLYFLIEIN